MSSNPLSLGIPTLLTRAEPRSEGRRPRGRRHQTGRATRPTAQSAHAERAD